MDIRLPSISGRTEREQLDEIKRYLYYLADTLSFALSGKMTDAERIPQSVGIPSGIEAQNLFHAIKGLIIHSDAIYHEFVSRYESEAESTWQTLGLSSPAEGAYCRFRTCRHRVYIEFACPADAEVFTVNAEALPDGYRPDRETVFVCACDTGYARASVNTDGAVVVAGGEGTVYGNISYFYEGGKDE